MFKSFSPEKVITIIVIMLMAVCISIVISVIESTSMSMYPYDMDWIKGRTADEIVAEYGEPDIWTTTKFGYDVGRSWDNPENVNDYYYIEFDENGCANDVYIALQPGG